ncbi:MAG: hypothetical protein A4E55_00141 [Pelotomaculum sp. PtaU1.Bin035]|nr:MAG: hypothetical protein A4E55_00141 [Pelotomaculum sp. PtaU1.Bin035]
MVLVKRLSILALFTILLGMFWIVSNNVNSKTNTENFFLSETNLTKDMGDGSFAVVNLDKQGYTDLKQMTSSAGFIIVGTVKEVQGTVNLARNIYNTDEPDNNNPVIAKKYLISVEETIKGETDKEIIVTQEYLINDNMNNNYNLEQNEIPLEIGSRYVLFLFKNTGKTKELKETYFRIGDPWQIKLINNESSVICGNKDISKHFYRKTENEIIREMKSML